MNIDLYDGDCIKIMEQLINQGIKVDFIYTDLPYGTTNCSWDSLIDLNYFWERIDLIKRNKHTPIALFAQTPFDKILGASNIKQLKYEWIWEKTSATGHLNSKEAPMKAHENILIFYEKPPVYNPIMTKGNERKVSKAKHKEFSEKTKVYGDSKNTTYDSTERFPRDVLLFPTDKQNFSIHPTQKPMALNDYMILTYTNEGDTILDCTMGSGGSMRSANKLRRNGIGIDNGKCEKEKSKYFGMRWKDVVEDLLKEDNKQPSLF